MCDEDGSSMGAPESPLPGIDDTVPDSPLPGVDDEGSGVQPVERDSPSLQDACVANVHTGLESEAAAVEGVNVDSHSALHCVEVAAPSLGKRRDETDAPKLSPDAEPEGKRTRHGDVPAQPSAFEGLVFTASDGKRLTVPRKLPSCKVRG